VATRRGWGCQRNIQPEAADDPDIADSAWKAALRQCCLDALAAGRAERGKTEMDPIELNIRSAQNNRWSNDRLYRAVLSLKPGEFEAERVSFFPSIKDTLNHILPVDPLFLIFL